MNVLVTGATGFLGTALCRRLEMQGHQIEALSSRRCDLTRQDALRQFNGRRFDRIFHLAAWTQAGDFCLHHPGEQWIINQQINTNVLAWWHQHQPHAQLIAIGTSCAYAPSGDLREDAYLEGTPIESLFTYGMTKRMLHAGMLALGKQFGHRFLTVVPSTLYGPGYHLDGRQMHFIFDLIRKILRGKFLGETVALWGDGQQKRELVYRDDFLDLMLQLAESAKYDLINIGAGEEHSIRHFAELISQIVEFDPACIRFDASKYVGARSKCLNIDRLRECVPDLALTPLADGLERTVKWALDNRGLFLAG